MQQWASRELWERRCAGEQELPDQELLGEQLGAWRLKRLGFSKRLSHFEPF